jgi:hypothetical protein
MNTKSSFLLTTVILVLAICLFTADLFLFDDTYTSNSRIPTTVHGMYLSSAPMFGRSNYDDYLMSISGTDVDFSGLKFIHKSNGSTKNLNFNGYSYNIVVFYNCGTRYKPFEDTVASFDSLEAAHEDYRPDAWTDEFEKSFNDYFLDRINLVPVCLTDRHPSDDYYVLHRDLAGTGSVKQYLESVLGEGKISFDLPLMRHYVLILNPDGSLLTMNNTVRDAFDLFVRASFLIDKPYTVGLKESFGTVYLGFGRPDMIQHLDVLAYNRGNELIDIVSNIQNTVFEAQKSTVNLLKENGIQ